MTLPLGRTYPVERGPDGRLIVDLAKCPPGRSQEEMQITLARLAGEFGVDIAPAQGLAGAELAAWLEQAEDQVFHLELAELQRQREEGAK